MARTSLTSRVLIARNGWEGPEYYQAGDSSCKPGMIVMEDDADEVKVCTSTGKPIGVVGCDADHDLSTVYTAGERIPIWTLGSGVDIYIKHGGKASDTVEKGSIMETASSTTYVGTMQEYIRATITTAVLAAKVTERLIGPGFWIGRSLETITCTTGTARFIAVRLSL